MRQDILYYMTQLTQNVQKMDIAAIGSRRLISFHLLFILAYCPQKVVCSSFLNKQKCMTLYSNY